MSRTFDETKLKALATELDKDIKTEKDLSKTVETALNKELDEHLGYEKHAIAGRNSGNSRNGSSVKTLKGDHGAVVIETPRDRAGSFEQQLVKKNQTRLTQFDEQILCLYAKGNNSRPEDWIENAGLKTIRHDHLHMSAKLGTGYNPRIIKGNRKRYYFDD